MNNNCLNRYKSSRISAGITQERAAELLGVSTRSLCDYENDHMKVPNDIAASMAEIYNNPMLEWLHLRENSAISKYLPEVAMPQGNGDMAYQLILLQDDLAPTVSTIKRIMANRQVDSHEKAEFCQQIGAMRRMAAGLLALIVYAEQIEKEGETQYGAVIKPKSAGRV
ncbi:MAG: helix-turn-helix domain-containing protein [Clostridiales bacterium]|jgi:DNA-binding XRE family transcriptional regulator|nr:helix-turn-helix domain-containing protein [Clostridiales bacterium]